MELPGCELPNFTLKVSGVSVVPDDGMLSVEVKATLAAKAVEAPASKNVAAAKERIEGRCCAASLARLFMFSRLKVRERLNMRFYYWFYLLFLFVNSKA